MRHRAHPGCTLVPRISAKARPAHHGQPAMRMSACMRQLALCRQPATTGGARRSGHTVRAQASRCGVRASAREGSRLLWANISSSRSTSTIIFTPYGRTCPAPPRLTPIQGCPRFKSPYEADSLSLAQTHPMPKNTAQPTQPRCSARAAPHPHVARPGFGSRKTRTGIRLWLRL
jgi:hypothetical protein